MEQPSEAPPVKPQPKPRRAAAHVPAAAVAVGAMLLLARRLLGKRRGAQDADPDASDGASVPRPVQLTWRNVSCTLTRKQKGAKPTETPLLQSVSGAASPGRLLAILGPSGAGKTTLLNALAGQVPRTAGLRLSGVVSATGGGRQGYVTQDDAFFAQDTVKETLTLAAQLRLPRRMQAEHKEALVARLIAQLGLARVVDTRVGGAKTRGISGGERKRLAIACELLASPSLLFLDEPTSGLDAFSALSVMQALKALACRGHTVVASVHQPRGSIWALFDDVALLAEGGQLLYHGPASGAMAHLAKAGIPCPADSNPAEVLLDSAAVDYSSPEAEVASRQRVARLAAAWAQRGGEDDAAVLAAPPASQRELATAGLPWWVQFRLLLSRAWRQAWRDRAALRARFASSLSSASVFAAIFWRLDASQAAIQSRLGLLQVCCVNAAMSSLVKTLQLFPRERAVVARERANAHYGVAPYFIAKLAAELPVGALFPALFGAAVYPACGLRASLPRFARFLGVLTLESFSASALGMTISAAVPSAQAALAAGPAVMLVFIIFGGQYVNQATVPAPLRWVPSVSLIKQAFEALCINELQGATFTASQPGDAATGEQVLRRIAYQDSIGATLAAQTGILIFNWAATYGLLVRRTERYAEIEAPAPHRKRSLDASSRAPQVAATLHMEAVPADVLAAVVTAPPPSEEPAEAEEPAAEAHDDE